MRVYLVADSSRPVSPKLTAFYWFCRYRYGLDYYSRAQFPPTLLNLFAGREGIMFRCYWINWSRGYKLLGKFNRVMMKKNKGSVLLNKSSRSSLMKVLLFWRVFFTRTQTNLYTREQTFAEVGYRYQTHIYATVHYVEYVWQVEAHFSLSSSLILYELVARARIEDPVAVFTVAWKIKVKFQVFNWKNYSVPSALNIMFYLDLITEIYTISRNFNEPTGHKSNVELSLFLLPDQTTVDIN